VPEEPEPDAAVVVEGQRLFAEYTLEVLMILACYSLPASYAARKGVQVLYQTGYLAERPNRRLFQTAQMVIDVMAPGGLGPGGKGRMTAKKVRLMHAAIRRLILGPSSSTWSPELGTPINQEDLAGTLMTFSWLILDGLRKLEIEVSPDRAEAYLRAWQVVGRLMGIKDELIPGNVDEAHELSDIIQRRQICPSPEGALMTGALLQGLRKRSPPLMKGVPSALMRHFLPEEVADGLGVPTLKLEAWLVSFGLRAGRELNVMTGWARKLCRSLGVYLFQVWFLTELGGRERFRVPSQLEEGWRKR
jgi:hypothetical protein